MTDTKEFPILYPLDDRGRASLFTEARTARSFRDEPVSDEQLKEIWELAKWAPTSRDMQPMRVLYIRTPDGVNRLLPHIEEFNRPKTAKAAAVAVLSVDLDFHELIPRLTPDRPERKDTYIDVAYRHEFARFNATLQAGYFILAIRAAGLGAGPMLGFDGPGIDREFFEGTAQETLLVVNIGHPGEGAWRQRGPRLDLDEVVSWA